MNQTFIVLGFLIFIIYLLIYNDEPFYDFKNVPKNYESAEIIIGIPKIIHHICPRDYKRWHTKWINSYESWLRLFPEPEYTHMHWYDDELHLFIESDFPWFLEIFNAYDKNIKRIDMIRPFILYTYGAIYADMDFEAISNFYDDLPNNKVSIVESGYKWNEEITNALIASPIKHIFWFLVIDECYNHKDNSNVLLSTGPQLISKIFKSHPQFIYVLPFNLYNPPPWDLDLNIIKAKHHNTVVW